MAPRSPRLAASTSDDALARQAAFWVARIDEGAGRRGPAAARYRAIARNAPLSYYRFAAEARLRGLDSSVRELNQSRQDAVKRIDELIAQLERVESELDRRPRADSGD